MQPLQKKKITFKSFVEKLACFSVFAYIVSAISCEMVENTAFISTIAIYLVFAVGVLFVIINDKIVINEYIVLYLSFCLCVFAMLIAPGSPPGTGTQIAYLLFTCIVLCFLFFWISYRINTVIPMAMAAYIIGALILAIRLIDAYGGISRLILFASEEGENRVGGLLGNANAIGLFFSTGILCSLVFFIKSKKFLVKVLMILSMLALGFMMLLTGSRKSLAFALVGIVLMVIMGYRKARLRKKLTVLIILTMVLAAIHILITTLPVFATINERFNLLFDGMSGSNTSYWTDQYRKIMAQQGLEAFAQKPIFGHGTGYSYALFGTYSHNNFVELLMNYGIVGFTLYYAFHAVLLIKLFKRVMKNDIYAMFFFIYVCIQVVLGVGWITYYERPVQIISALAFGYIVSTKTSKKKEFNNETEKPV